MEFTFDFLLVCDILEQEHARTGDEIRDLGVLRALESMLLIRLPSAMGRRKRERSFDVNDGRIDVLNAVTIESGAIELRRKRQRKFGTSQTNRRRISQRAAADVVNQGFNELSRTFAVTALQLGDQ